jgi:hypothetical protein
MVRVLALQTRAARPRSITIAKHKTGADLFVRLGSGDGHHNPTHFVARVPKSPTL